MPNFIGTRFPTQLRALVLLIVVCCDLPVMAGESSPSREEVVAAMLPYDGPSAPGVDCSTLTGKVICGYQGWFTTPGDDSQRGWRHYPARGQFKPGSCGIDLWPDMSELDEDEKYPTPFRHKDDRLAQVFSSHNRKTVLRHFQWMHQYGIEGVFVQRFGVETFDPKDLRHCNVVLAHCREGANRNGRCYAVMYDLSGLPTGGTRHVIEDWKLLVDRMQIGRDRKDAAYLRHGGKPVVAVWGVGFNDGRKYTLEECERLVDFLKSDPRYGGFSVMLGVPTGWRTQDADSVSDPTLHRIIGKADIVSPWTVGRYKSLKGIEDHAQRRWQKDLEWCREKGKVYLPVAFPGFSWHNRHPRSPLDEIPRMKGRFLWKQYVEAKKAGATTVYQAMFDEMDEGTAIFKCTNDPPVGENPFVTLEGLPSDHYLWLTGMGRKLLRGEFKASEDPPQRKTDIDKKPKIKNQTRMEPKPFVEVADDKKTFVLKPSGKKFTPWGFNYDHDSEGRLLEDYWEKEWDKVEAHFGQMKKLGANVVRIHLQVGKFMEAADKPNEKALDRLAELVGLAETVGLHLDLTGLGCYHKKDVPAWYDALSEKERWSVQVRFWQAVAGRCAESPAIFCYDLMNEPVVLGGKGKDWLGPPFGGKHFVQFITLDQADRPRPDIARQWVHQLATAIRQKDKRHLITVGLVDWSLDRPGLTSGFVPTKLADELDFISVHLYPKSKQTKDALETLAGFAVGKPVLIEETFPLACSAKELEEFIDGSKKHAAGWIGFYWGKPPEELRRSKTIPDALTLGWLELFEKKAKVLEK